MDTIEWFKYQICFDYYFNFVLFLTKMTNVRARHFEKTHIKNELFILLDSMPFFVNSQFLCKI